MKIQHRIQRMGSVCRISISLEHRGSRWRVHNWNVCWKHCYQHFRCLFDCFNVHRTDTFALPKVSLSSSTDHYGDHPPQRHTWQIRLMFCAIILIFMYCIIIIKNAFLCARYLNKNGIAIIKMCVRILLYRYENANCWLILYKSMIGYHIRSSYNCIWV